MPEKNFDEWNRLKQRLDATDRVAFIHEGDVWFCSIGKNVGQEQDGKHALYEWPILIVRTFTKNYFLGVPLSSKTRIGPYSMPITYHGQSSVGLLFHMRAFDCKRLQRRLGRISDDALKDLKQKLMGLLTN